MSERHIKYSDWSETDAAIPSKQLSGSPSFACSHFKTLTKTRTTMIIIINAIFFKKVVSTFLIITTLSLERDNLLIKQDSSLLENAKTRIFIHRLF